jgi:hypothetical protein
MIKRYSVNFIIKIITALFSLFLICGEIFFILRVDFFSKRADFIFIISSLPLISLLIFSIATMRIELFDNYFIYKQFHLKAKIEFKDIFDVTSQIIGWRWYFIRYYKDGVLIRRIMQPMHNMYDFLNEIKKKRPDIILEQRITLEINKLKSRGKIS